MPIDTTNIGDELTKLLPAEPTNIDSDHESEVENEFDIEINKIIVF